MTFMPETSDLASALAGYGRRTNPFDARRKYGYQLLQAGTDTSPVQSPWQGAARLAQALAGGLELGMTDSEEKAAEKKRSDALAQAMAEPDPQKRIGLLAAYDPDKGATAAGQLAIEQYKQNAGRQMLEAGANSFGGPRMAGGAPTALGANATAISGIESAGQPNNGYGAVGPIANPQGDRAYGKFQVMGANVGPWTQEVLGKAMTPQEFLQSPEAQNAVFEAKFGQYVTKYGSPQAASRAWFAGEGGMNNPNARDVNGMTTARYEQQFNRNLPPETPDAPPMQQPPPGVQPGGLQIDMPGPRPQAPQQSGAVGQPPPVTGQNVNGPAVMAAQMPPGVAPPAVPDVPRPQPTPEQIQSYQQRIRSGEFGQGPEAISKARAALDADLDRQWTVDRERRTLEYKQQLGDYQQGQKQRGELEQKAPMELIAKRVDNYENKLRPAAVSAVNDINAIHTVRQVLDAGAFTGTGADAKTMLAKLGEQLGFPSDQAVNTQVLGAVLAKRVLAASGGTLGTGFSNADRDFVERASGGQIAMDEAAMRRLADIGERDARMKIKQHDDEAARIKKMPGVAQLGDEQFTIPAASSYDEFRKANPLPSAQPGAAAAPQGAPRITEGATATNPQTGQKIRFQNGQWVPVQ
jgi:hypothetical protein